jgi:hypothetical protein
MRLVESEYGDARDVSRIIPGAQRRGMKDSEE